ncbi:MAG: FAD-dependent oxidoreductase [Erythrobacter sp.]|uniref:FAD-dependent oxidoreductase n=1 Tax=Erythrobacter sp. TaxID=1042 RepID=UPI00260C8EA7|nr:FAD-dependent oxidoreductase [Erythrobacter sp.]MDJ0977685.1 FAD-dependent oxidoreductase [Erythrobacter sp.]
MKVTVCTRPFRPAGPRLEIERFGEKTVVHNYGHGGSGWSLSWGCAAQAAALARSQGHSEFAVLGAGVIGLTTALRLLESGARVTIYAEDFPAETRSARATGVWSPSSRIGLASEVPPGFAQRWEEWTRYSHARHLQMVGLDDAPIEYQTQYYLRGGVMERTPASRDFLELGRGLRNLNPPWTDTDPERDPFPGKARRKGQSMIFNVTGYFDRLARQFERRGGRMVRRAFAERSEALALPEPVILNCMGYGAKSLWGDETLVPVRGQINWLVPQPRARYGFFYDGVSAISRRDGVIIQYTGPNDDFGYANASESVDAAETDRALATVRRAYE